MSTKIIGTGSFIPEHIRTNEHFLNHSFHNADGSSFEVGNDVIIEKFKSITGIEERRYAKDHHTTSDLAFFAAERAIEDAQIDPESLDYIIVGHNFGDVRSGQLQSVMLPAIAARVKQSLEIKNNY